VVNNRQQVLRFGAEPDTVTVSQTVRPTARFAGSNEKTTSESLAPAIAKALAFLAGNAFRQCFPAMLSGNAFRQCFPAMLSVDAFSSWYKSTHKESTSKLGQQIIFRPTQAIEQLGIHQGIAHCLHRRSLNSRLSP
jgi:hypothetical protein